jgi:choline dehydrogenase
MLSGVGAAEHLAAHGIAAVVPNANVGAHLQDHLQLRTVFKVANTRTLNTMVRSPAGCARIAWDYAAHRRGPLAAAPSQLAAFVRSWEHGGRGVDAARSGEAPDAEFHVQPLSLDAFGEPLHKFDAFTAAVCNLRPTSAGAVTLRSASPFAHPVVAPRYLATAADRAVAADCIRFARAIARQPALAPFAPREHYPGPEVGDDDEAGLVAAAGRIGTTIFHPSSTTRMSATAAGGVVDGRLRVHGVANLRVADTGVMPRITSGNTNAPTIMIAERAAAWILDASLDSPAP